ncbi:GH32 C-terminal domain-containing protein [Capnocytophaga leadbetteri]|uniref:GH32 C-terminal domain-containing protein n=1 Tax=Capnocytophaga leadbetteri TaxID=327575 RepID=UPI0028D3B2D0|nr:GH32 C-terminal domain-containing protein [Capnocytophaga leadbetteri]
MKRNNITPAYIIAVLALMTACQHQEDDLIIEDFESGTYANWTVEGDAFGATPATGSYTGQQPVIGFEGKRLANSFNNGDDSRGTLTSKEFTIERNYINFLIGGGTNPDTYIELLVDGKSVLKSHSLFETETLQWLTWDVKAYKNKKATIRIVDNQRGGWGHILIDQIEQGNKQKSVFMTEYTRTFEAKDKYLLIPVEDQAVENSVQFSVDGNPIGEPMTIRIAQNKIDYWVPIDIESYKGKKVTLTFAVAKTTDMGLAEIKQAGEYNFNYSEKYRPLYHFTPQYGWMNDPNGMVYADGTYHLFYQYNPYGARWGNMHWGHAISKDLVNWEYQPTAIAPDKLGAIFSGSAVIDHDNTAGFGKGAMIAIFTSAGDRQTQSIAYSLDGGKTFTKYEGNPVLTDANIIDFRDPKVFWHAPSKQWVMSLATTQTITFYGSKNLKEWTRLSEFGEGLGGHGGVWECPDLFPLTYEGKTKWVLFVSINPGGTNGGSATQYFIGNFDGKTFTPDAMNYPLWLDYGRDNYAGVTWSNVPAADGRRLFIGWMSNWDYANEIPTVNFRSAMTVARTLRLAHNGEHLVVASEPVKEVESLRRDPLSLADKTTSDTVTFENLLPNNQGAYELTFTVTPNDTDSFSFSIENTKGEVLTYLFDIANKTLSVDRSKSSVAFNANFAETLIKAPLTAKKSYTVRLLVDKASTELFVNNGEVVQTNTVFPSEVYNTLRFKTEKGTLNLNDITVYKLK